MPRGGPEVTKATPTYYVDEGGIVTVGIHAPRTKGEFCMLKTKVAEILEGGGRFCRPRDRSYPVSTNFGPCYWEGHARLCTRGTRQRLITGVKSTPEKKTITRDDAPITWTFTWARPIIQVYWHVHKKRIKRSAYVFLM